MKNTSTFRYSGKDVTPWEVVDRTGKVLTYEKDKKKNIARGFDGFKTANEMARMLGGVARRSRR